MSTVMGDSPTSLDDLVANPSLEEVWVNGPNQVFVAEAGVSKPVPIVLSAMDIRAFVERTLRLTGRRVDVSSPFVDASLPDGSRLHVVIPDIKREHWSINIRKFSPSLRRLDDLVTAEVMTAAAAIYLRESVADGKSVLVSGATQAGKTTMLMALLDFSGSALRPRASHPGLSSLCGSRLMLLSLRVIFCPVFSARKQLWFRPSQLGSYPAMGFLDE